MYQIITCTLKYLIILFVNYTLIKLTFFYKNKKSTKKKKTEQKSQHRFNVKKYIYMLFLVWFKSPPLSINKY